MGRNILTIFSPLCCFVQLVPRGRVGGEAGWCKQWADFVGAVLAWRQQYCIVPSSPLLLPKPLWSCCRSQRSSHHCTSLARAYVQGVCCWRAGKENLCLPLKALRWGETGDQGGSEKLSSINQSLNNLTEWLGNAMLPAEALGIYIYVSLISFRPVVFLAPVWCQAGGGCCRIDEALPRWQLGEGWQSGVGFFWPRDAACPYTARKVKQRLLPQPYLHSKAAGLVKCPSVPTGT